MKFREERVELLRIRLEKNNFYEDIIFKDEIVCKKVKKIVAKWMAYLKEYRQIEVEKFRDLFYELDEVIFPIKIKKIYGRNSAIIFLDAQGNEWYMSRINSYGYDILTTYIIGRRNSSLEPLVNREFYYQINKDKTLRLIRTSVRPLKKDGTNKDIVLSFCYNHKEHTTEATLKSDASSKKIRIKYPIISDVFDKMLLKFLFDSNESKWYYYDVYPILKWIVTVVSDEKASIFIATEIEKEIFSELEVVNGIVQKYTVTKIINEGEMHIIKKLFAKELNKFLAERELI